MAHGYLGDGFGSHGEIDPDRDDDRGRRWRENDWREDRTGQDRSRNPQMMFGDRNDWNDRDRPDQEHWDSRGWRSQGRGDQWGSGSEDYRSRGQQGSTAGYGGYSRARRSFSASPDDHYRSWRDRHMSELDRDYEDYCREREQQFHRDFDEWRKTRRPGGKGRQDEIAQESELELTHERALVEEGNTPSPVGDATLGTNNSENSLPGRARPRR